MKHCICSIPFCKMFGFLFWTICATMFLTIRNVLGKKNYKMFICIIWHVNNRIKFISFSTNLCTFDRFDIYLANIHPLFLYIAFPITVKIYSAIYSSLNHLKLKMLFINGGVHWDRYKDLEPDRSKKRKSDNLQSIPLRQ